MSEDQTTPEVEQQTPPEPTDGGTSESVDYQKRYDDLRPQYDRTQSELNALKQWQEAVLSDDAAFAALAEQRGYQIDQGDEPESFEDTENPQLSAFEQRLAAIEAKEQEAEAVRQMQEVERIFDSSFSSIAKDRGKPLTEKEQGMVKSHAILNNLTPEDAYKDLTELYESQLEDWASTKKTPHRVSATGGEATQQPDMDDPTARQAWMAERLAELNSST